METNFAKKYWPLASITLEIDDLVLNEINDSNMAELTQLSLNGIVNLDENENVFMPAEFFLKHTDETDVHLVYNHIRWTLAARSKFSPEHPEFIFCVNKKTDAGLVPMGVQALHPPSDFLTVRGYNSGSWLGKDFQGQGVGKKMRMAVLHFGFEYMDCNFITSGYHEDNAASKQISRTMGYVENGYEYTGTMKTKERARFARCILERDVWQESVIGKRAKEEVQVNGWDDLDAWFDVLTPKN